MAQLICYTCRSKQHSLCCNTVTPVVVSDNGYCTVTPAAVNTFTVTATVTPAAVNTFTVTATVTGYCNSTPTAVNCTVTPAAVNDNGYGSGTPAAVQLHQLWLSYTCSGTVTPVTVSDNGYCTVTPAAVNTFTVYSYVTPVAVTNRVITVTVTIHLLL